MDDEKIVDNPINQKRVLLYGVASLVALVIALPYALLCLISLEYIWPNTGGFLTPNSLSGLLGASIFWASWYTVWLSIFGLKWSFKRKCQGKIVQNVLAIWLAGIMGSFFLGFALFFFKYNVLDINSFSQPLYYSIFSILAWLPAIIVQKEMIQQSQDKRMYFWCSISFIVGVILNLLFIF